MAAFIRQAKPEDKEAMAHICRVTFPPSLQGSEPALRIGPYLWTHQFPFLSPKTCFVVDDGSGHAVGYCIGCPSVPAFIDAYPRYVTEVLDATTDVPRPDDLTNKAPWLGPDGKVSEVALAQMAYNPHFLLEDGNADVLAEHKATMHIDLLPEWQGKGWGTRLIEAYVAACKAGSPEGSKGIFIGIAGDNAKVVKFYETVGFKVWEREGAKPSGGITMVYVF